MDDSEICVETVEDKKNLIDSVKNVVIDTITNLDYLQYHDYNFEENFKSVVYQSFQDINFEDFDNCYYDIIDSLSVVNSNHIWRSHKKNLHRFDYFENKYLKKIEYLKKCPQQSKEQKNGMFLEIII